MAEQLNLQSGLLLRTRLASRLGLCLGRLVQTSLTAGLRARHAFTARSVGSRRAGRGSRGSIRCIVHRGGRDRSLGERRGRRSFFLLDGGFDDRLLDLGRAVLPGLLVLGFGGRRGELAQGVGRQLQDQDPLGRPRSTGATVGGRRCSRAGGRHGVDHPSACVLRRFWGKAVLMLKRDPFSGPMKISPQGVGQELVEAVTCAGWQ